MTKNIKITHLYQAINNNMRMRGLINNHHYSINQSDDCMLVDVMSANNQIAAFSHQPITLQYVVT